MFEEKDYGDYVKLAAHYQAIGESKIYLDGNGEKPWQYAKSCEPAEVIASTYLRMCASQPAIRVLSSLGLSTSNRVQPMEAVRTISTWRAFNECSLSSRWMWPPVLCST